MDYLMMGIWLINLISSIITDDKHILRIIAICGSLIAIAHFAQLIF